MSRQGAYEDITNPTWYRRSSKAERNELYAEMWPEKEPEHVLRLSDFFPKWGARVAERERRAALTARMGGVENQNKILAEYHRLRAEANKGN